MKNFLVAILIWMLDRLITEKYQRQYDCLKVQLSLNKRLREAQATIQKQEKEMDTVMEALRDSYQKIRSVAPGGYYYL